MKSFIRWVDGHLEAALGGALLAGIVGLISIQVVMRYVFENALSWSEELTIWFFIWFIWLGISYAFKERKHVKVSFFQNMLSKKVLAVLELVIDIIIVAFLLKMSFEAYKLMTLPYVVTQKSVVLNLPIPILYASAPVGALLSVMRIIQFHLKKLTFSPSLVEAK